MVATGLIKNLIAVPDYYSLMMKLVKRAPVGWCWIHDENAPIEVDSKEMRKFVSDYEGFPLYQIDPDFIVKLAETYQHELICLNVYDCAITQSHLQRLLGCRLKMFRLMSNAGIVLNLTELDQMQIRQFVVGNSVQVYPELEYIRQHHPNHWVDNQLNSVVFLPLIIHDNQNVLEFN